MTSEVHHRHPLHGGEGPKESSPLLFVRHMSVEEEDDKDYFHSNANRHAHHHNEKGSCWTPLRVVSAMFAFFVIAIAVLMALHNEHHRPHQSPLWPYHNKNNIHSHDKIFPIEMAHEHWLPLDNSGTMKIWFRTWGNPTHGIPLLFVHGGPGNAIADYHNENKYFFADDLFYVVEVDQRGTGNSQPSVRDSWKNMKYFQNISIDEMAADFELVRESLGIEKWLVWGGSFGSTVGINYGTRYPERCLAMILRGIYLDTAEEVDAIYSRKTYMNNPKRLAEFDTFFSYVQTHAPPGNDKTTTTAPLDPNDAEGIMRVYASLITRGDPLAIWHWHVFENNLMETDPANILDPDVIDNTYFPEAQSVAFFETRLWLHGSYEAPSNLMSRIDQLTGFPIWICQGKYDEVCPPRYAQKLADALEEVDAQITMRSIPSGHEQSDPIMAKCLDRSLREYIEDYAEPMQT